MMNPKFRTGLVLASLVAIVGLSVGCGSDETVSTGDDSGVGAGSTGSGESGSSEGASDPSSGELDWRTRSLTYTDGSEIAVADIEGRPVFVETFATWCSSCEKQLKVSQLAARDAGDDAVFLAISVETDLSVADLEKFLEHYEYGPIKFAIATPEMLLDLKNAFGNVVLTPPSTPKIIVGADGGEPEMVTGQESAKELTERLGLA